MTNKKMAADKHVFTTAIEGLRALTADEQAAYYRRKSELFAEAIERLETQVGLVSTLRSELEQQNVILRTAGLATADLANKANARAAELEAQVRNLQGVTEVLSDAEARADAANARAERVEQERAFLANAPAAPIRATPEPIPMVLHCPECRARHIDEGEFATRSHHTHSCQQCGMTWRPAVVPTCGVRFLPGFKNPQPVAPPASSDEGPLAAGQCHVCKALPGERCDAGLHS